MNGIGNNDQPELTTADPRLVTRTRPRPRPTVCRATFGQAGLDHRQRGNHGGEEAVGYVAQGQGGAVRLYDLREEEREDEATGGGPYEVGSEQDIRYARE